MPLKGFIALLCKCFYFLATRKSDRKKVIKQDKAHTAKTCITICKSQKVLSTAKVFLQILFAEFVSQITSGRVSLDTMALQAVMKSEWVK